MGRKLGASMSTEQNPHQLVIDDLVKRGILKPQDLVPPGAAPHPQLLLSRPMDVDTDGPLLVVAKETLQAHRRKLAKARQSALPVHVFGPYKDRRVFLGSGAAFRTPSPTLTTLAEGNRLKELLHELIVSESEVTIAQALEQYRAFREAQGGTRPGSERTTFARLSAFFINPSDSLRSLTHRSCDELYRTLASRPLRNGKTRSVATHRGELAQAKTFGAWCVEHKLLTVNPLAAVKPVGRLPHGKEQLRIDEARKLADHLVWHAKTGNPAPLAVLIVLMCGLRASEVIALRCRDVDNEGSELVISGGKTASAARRVQVPQVLRQLLIDAADDRSANVRLLNNAEGGGVKWLLRATHKYCREAGVPQVTTHSLRGLHSSLAIEAGQSPRSVADTLGHSSPKTTLQSYTTQEAAAAGKHRRAVDRLQRPE